MVYYGILNGAIHVFVLDRRCLPLGVLNRVGRGFRVIWFDEIKEDYTN